MGRERRFPTNWSVGKVVAYEDCPKMYEGRYVLRLPERKSPAMERGNVVHAKLERFLKGELKQVPAEAQGLAAKYRALRRLDPMTEQRVAVDRRWNLVAWSRGWLKCIFDALHVEPTVVKIVDHKTGRVYPHHSCQAEVYACAIANLEPGVREFDVEFLYVDKGFSRPWNFTRARVESLQESWAERAERTLTARRFPATPSEPACRWCPRRTDRGGDCARWQEVGR